MNKAYSPLASLLRPKTLENYIGQKHIIGEGTILRKLINADNVPSMVFWGPPGVGKTTLAQIIAETTKSNFVNFSAVSTGIKEVRIIMNEAEELRHQGIKTIVFIDEIHRFNKAQQDAFLPYVEKGSIILIGATTENPSFEVNSALLSRCKVFVLKSLNDEDICEIIDRAILEFSKDNNCEIEMSDKLKNVLANFSNGDARTAINTMEMMLNSNVSSKGKTIITDEIVEQSISKKILMYDKNGEEHYNIISALHKSMRNSDVQAAIYWLCRMLDSGEDPLYIARRVVRFASEDIGMADSGALAVAIDAYQACHFIGMPECGVHLTHAVSYCSLAPKSNSLDVAYNRAMEDVRKMPSEPVPMQIRNAPTKLMKDLGYGKGYQYAHDLNSKIANMQCLPDKLVNRKYYVPSNQGRELRVKEWMDKLEEMKKKQ